MYPQKCCWWFTALMFIYISQNLIYNLTFFNAGNDFHSTLAIAADGNFENYRPNHKEKTQDHLHDRIDKNDAHPVNVSYRFAAPYLIVLALARLHDFPKRHPQELRIVFHLKCNLENPLITYAFLQSQ